MRHVWHLRGRGSFFGRMDGVFACWIFFYFNMRVFHLVFRGFDQDSRPKFVWQVWNMAAGKYPHWRQARVRSVEAMGSGLQSEKSLTSSNNNNNNNNYYYYYYYYYYHHQHHYHQHQHHYYYHLYYQLAAPPRFFFSFSELSQKPANQSHVDLVPFVGDPAFVMETWRKSWGITSHAGENNPPGVSRNVMTLGLGENKCLGFQLLFWKSSNCSVF